MVILTTGIMFLIFTCMHFWVWEFYGGGPRLRRTPMKWSAIAGSLKQTGLEH
jgi:hypothetical protein